MASDPSQPAPLPQGTESPSPTPSSPPVGPPEPTTPPAVTRAPATTARTEESRQSVRIFTYPKIIFIWPTLVAALICGIGMAVIRNDTADPKKVARFGQEKVVEVVPAHGADDGKEKMLQVQLPIRFNSPQNLFALFFLGVFAFNMIVMSLDFPRFTLVGGVLLVIALISFLGWLSLALGVTFLKPLIHMLEGIYLVANAQFYFMVALIIAFTFVMVWLTRWLDYWEVRPNELLHHHGPLSDLGRYPTMNLKFDKEIPDVLEYMMLGAGRLVIQVPTEDRAFILDNVMWIDDKERKLKGLMSRMEVRVTTDQEAVES